MLGTLRGDTLVERCRRPRRGALLALWGKTHARGEMVADFALHVVEVLRCNRISVWCCVMCSLAAQALGNTRATRAVLNAYTHVLKKRIEVARVSYGALMLCVW